MMISALTLAYKLTFNMIEQCAADKLTEPSPGPPLKLVCPKADSQSLPICTSNVQSFAFLLHCVRISSNRAITPKLFHFIHLVSLQC